MPTATIIVDWRTIMDTRERTCHMCHGTGFANGKICLCISGGGAELPDCFKDIFRGMWRGTPQNDTRNEGQNDGQKGV